MQADLTRFIDAQEDQYQTALSELRSGRKRGHWMWFIFPQVRGLGQTQTSWRYGIASSAEALAYMAHPVLGQRLLECTRTVLRFRHLGLEQIFPPPDNLKFRSCMTLFSLQEGAPPEFQRALDAFCHGQKDPKTTDLLNGTSLS